MNITVPATDKAPAATVELKSDNQVYWAGQCIGRIERRKFMDDILWLAHTPDNQVFNGHQYPDDLRQGSRRGAVAFLVASAYHGSAQHHYHWIS